MNENLVKASIVKFNLPFMINLPDDDYLVNLEDAKATITIKRERKNVNPTIPTNAVFPNEYILGDRWGRFSYSQIRNKI